MDSSMSDNMIPEAVLVSVQGVKGNINLNIHRQSGIRMGPFIITVGNKLFIPSPGADTLVKDIQITLADGLKKNATFCAHWESQDITEFLGKYLYKLRDYGVIDRIFHYYTYKSMTYFVLLLIDDYSDKQQNLISYMELTKNCLEVGEPITVTFTPFGHTEWLNSLAEGIISHTYGTENNVFLTDARLTSGCEGAPVYSSKPGKLPIKSLIGIIILNVPYYDGNKNQPSPFYLGVKWSAVINSLKSKFPKLPNTTTSMVSFFRDLSTSPSPKYTSEDVGKNGEKQFDIYRDDKNLNEAPIRFNFVVAIQCGAGSGTGFVLQDDGIIMTCAHVVNYSEGMDVSVTFLNKETYDGKVIFSTGPNCPIDVAFILIDSSKKFSKCAISRTRPTAGKCVWVLGHGDLCNQFTFFMSKGIISHYKEGEFIIASSPVLSGTSGGIIIDDNGDAVGLVTYMLIYGDKSFPHLNFCMPMYTIYDILQKFIETKDVSVLADILDVPCSPTLPKAKI